MQNQEEYSSEEALYVQQTLQWIKTVVIGYNFCPFAAPVLKKDTLRITVAHSSNEKEALQLLKQELHYLDAHPETETTLIIFPVQYKSFSLYLSVLKKAEKQLRQLQYEGIYQIASFHPDYTFADAEQEDAANYTNRSPYPMWHLIREASITEAVKRYKNPERIPQQNIELARSKGLAHMQQVLLNCITMKNH